MTDESDILIKWGRGVTLAHSNEKIDDEDYINHVCKGAIETALQLLEAIAYTESILIKGIITRTLMECAADINTILTAQNRDELAKKYIKKGKKVLAKANRILEDKPDKALEKRIWQASSIFDEKTLTERIQAMGRGNDNINTYDLLCHFAHANVTRFTLDTELIKEETLNIGAGVFFSSIVILVMLSDYLTKDDLLAFLVARPAIVRKESRLSIVILQKIATYAKELE